MTDSTGSIGTRSTEFLGSGSASNGTDGVYVMATDYVKALPHSIGKWFPQQPVALGTDGFGRSESRAALRRFFEVDAEHIVVATLGAPSPAKGASTAKSWPDAIAEFGIDLKPRTR